MISENVKALAEKYCMGIKPTNEQLDEIMDAVFAADDEIMEVSEYIEALQNGPTKEMVEAEKLKKEAEEHKKKIDAHKAIVRKICPDLLKWCEDEKEIREYIFENLIDEAKNMGASPDDIAEIENIIENAREKAIENLKRKKEEEARRKAEDAKRKAEDAKRKAEEEAKRKAEEEAKRKAGEEAKRKAEEEAKRKAEAEAKRKAEEEKKRQENMPKAKELYDRGKAKTKGLFSANYKEARVLFEESLALGYGDAAYEIAEMYKRGIGGCEKSLQEYLRLIDRGIELHSSYVAEQAAKDFRIGSGVVPKDKIKSAMYEGIATGIRNKYE